MSYPNKTKHIHESIRLVVEARMIQHKRENTLFIKIIAVASTLANLCGLACIKNIGDTLETETLSGVILASIHVVIVVANLCVLIYVITGYNVKRYLMHWWRRWISNRWREKDLRLFSVDDDIIALDKSVTYKLIPIYVPGGLQPVCHTWIRYNAVQIGVLQEKRLSPLHFMLITDLIWEKEKTKIAKDKIELFDSKLLEVSKYML